MDRPRYFIPVATRLIATIFVAWGALSCSEKETPPETPPATDKNNLTLTFTYGSEKEKWIEAMTAEFNAAGHQTSGGQKIYVDAIPMGSGECVDEIVHKKRETHLVSPASAVFISLGNAESTATSGEPMVGDTQDLVLSPVVIAMWKPMAEALGWPNKSIGWKEIHDLALNEQGWASLNNPQWGRFRFGHTHPEYSNSGIISLIAEVYAGAGKQRDLTLQDVATPQVGAYLEEIEKAIVHYGRSTGFFGRKMFGTGPTYLSAAVLYENMVIESHGMENLPFPIVALYPTEGTFYSDHPIGIVQRDYVTDAHREAAEQYIDFLTDSAQQTRAMEFGFRPADVSIPLSDTFSTANGVDPQQPQTTLEVPPVPVVDSILELWHQRKKKSNVALVLDISGSMAEEQKMENAKSGALQFLDMLGDNDQLSISAFNQAPVWLEKNQPVGPNRDAIRAKINGLFPNGGTALYDAIIDAHKHLTTNPSDDRITAMVVLSDGKDQSSTSQLPQVLSAIQAGSEGGSVRIFTIGYGSGASADVLEQIANATRSKYYQGTTDNIEKIFKEISTFF